MENPKASSDVIASSSREAKNEKAEDLRAIYQPLADLNGELSRFEAIKKLVRTELAHMFYWGNESLNSFAVFSSRVNTDSIFFIVFKSVYDSSLTGKAISINETALLNCVWTELI